MMKIWVPHGTTPLTFTIAHDKALPAATDIGLKSSKQALKYLVIDISSLTDLDMAGNDLNAQVTHMVTKSAALWLVCKKPRTPSPIYS